MKTIAAKVTLSMDKDELSREWKQFLFNIRTQQQKDNATRRIADQQWVNPTIIVNYGRAMGMTVAQPVVQQFYLQFQDLTNLLEKCKEKDIKMLFVVIPSGKDYHSKVKQMVDREVGIVTQCIREQTARKFMRLCIIKSIMMKVNLKLVGNSQALYSTSMPSGLQGAKRAMDVEEYNTCSSPKQKKVIVILLGDEM